MTEKNEKQDVKKDVKPAAPVQSVRPKKSLPPLIPLLLLSFFAGAGLHYALSSSGRMGRVFESIPLGKTSCEEKVENLEAQVASVMGRLAEVAQTADEAKAGMKPIQGPIASLDDLQKVRTAMGATLAFVEMQRDALAGKPFEEERQKLRTLVQDRPDLLELIGRLETPAVNGAPKVEVLREMWRAVAPEGQTALRKSAALTWQDRLVVALEGLVSIRSLKSEAGETLSFAAVDLDLARGDLPGALAKAEALPADVQDVVKGWTAKAKERVEMEKTLKDVATALIDEAPQPAPSGEEKAS